MSANVFLKCGGKNLERDFPKLNFCFDIITIKINTYKFCNRLVKVQNPQD